MSTFIKACFIGLLVFTLAPAALAQTPTQSKAPADVAVSKKISQALVKAGIDPRTTSVQVITTSSHVVYLKGLISDKQQIQLATKVAEQNAPGYKVVNEINSSFFADPNHDTGGAQDK